MKIALKVKESNKVGSEHLLYNFVKYQRRIRCLRTESEVCLRNSHFYIELKRKHCLYAE